MEKKIVICFATDLAKNMRLRLSLMTVDGKGRITSEHYHSINVEPDADFDAVREALEKSIADPHGGVPGAPWPKIPDDEWAHMEAHRAVVHKPDVVRAYREAKAKREAEAEIRRKEAREAAERFEAAKRTELATAVRAALKE